MCMWVGLGVGWLCDEHLVEYSSILKCQTIVSMLFIYLFYYYFFNIQYN